MPFLSHLRNGSGKSIGRESNNEIDARFKHFNVSATNSKFLLRLIVTSVDALSSYFIATLATKTISLEPSFKRTTTREQHMNSTWSQPILYTIFTRTCQLVVPSAWISAPFFASFRYFYFCNREENNISPSITQRNNRAFVANSVLSLPPPSKQTQPTTLKPFATPLTPFWLFVCLVCSHPPHLTQHQHPSLTHSSPLQKLSKAFNL